jgi:hypothetical protein
MFKWILANTPKGTNARYPAQILIKTSNGQEFVLHSYFDLTWKSDAPVISVVPGSIAAEQWSRR